MIEKMRVAIIISVSEYENIAKLPGCKNDFKLMSDLIKATDKYDEILEIYENTKSTRVKEVLTNFFTRIQNVGIDELFFYYTGHGAFDGEDLRFALTDYSSEKLNTTTLSNAFIDKQIRSFNPHLTVKVIDACNSGVPYIKGDIDLTQVYERKKDINNCYFMFSSHSDQSSYVDRLSHFTRSFAESVLNYEGSEISYTSIIDNIKDKFAHSNRQTPFFVAQGAMTDTFCVITDQIKNIDISKYMNIPDKSTKEPENLVKLVKERSGYYLSKDEIESILIRIKSELTRLSQLENFNELFNLEIEEVHNYRDIFGIKGIAKWVDENPNDYFVKLKKEKEEYKNAQGELFGNIQFLSNLLSPKYEPVDISTQLEVVFDALKLKATPRFPALLPYQCNIVFLLSRYDMAVFYKFISFIETGWEIYNFGSSTKWKTFKIFYKEIESNIDKFDEITEEYRDYIENDIRKRLETKLSD